MSDMIPDLSVEPPYEVPPVGLGEQPFVTNIQTVEQHFDQRQVAKATAVISLQKLLDTAELELANLVYSPASRALGSCRSHLAFVVSQTRHILDTLSL